MVGWTYLDTAQSWLWLVYVLIKNDPDQSWSWSILIIMKLNTDKQIFLEYSRFDSKMVPEVNIIRQYIMKISALHSQSVSNKVTYIYIYRISACPSFASKKTPKPSNQFWPNFVSGNYHDPWKGVCVLNIEKTAFNQFLYLNSECVNM